MEKKISYFSDMPKDSVLTMDNIAEKLTYFHEQLHLIHWQTKSYAEHQALGSLYEFVHSFKDDLIEKIMGYSGQRPGALKMLPLTSVPGTSVVLEIINFADQLKMYGEANKYHDVCNLADTLSGEAAKTKYLLTLA